MEINQSSTYLAVWYSLAWLVLFAPTPSSHQRMGAGSTCFQLNHTRIHTARKLETTRFEKGNRPLFSTCTAPKAIVVRMVSSYPAHSSPACLYGIFGCMVPNAAGFLAAKSEAVVALHFGRGFHVVPANLHGKEGWWHQ